MTTPQRAETARRIQTAMAVSYMGLGAWQVPAFWAKDKVAPTDLPSQDSSISGYGDRHEHSARICSRESS